MDYYTKTSDAGRTFRFMSFDQLCALLYQPVTLHITNRGVHLRTFVLPPILVIWIAVGLLLLLVTTPYRASLFFLVAMAQAHAMWAFYNLCVWLRIKQLEGDQLRTGRERTPIVWRPSYAQEVLQVTPVADEPQDR